jgi:hypothetical protein
MTFLHFAQTCPPERAYKNSSITAEALVLLGFRFTCPWNGMKRLIQPIKKVLASEGGIRLSDAHSTTIAKTEGIVFVANRISLVQSWPLKPVQIRFLWVRWVNLRLVSYSDILLVLVIWPIEGQENEPQLPCRWPRLEFWTSEVFFLQEINRTVKAIQSCRWAHLRRGVCCNFKSQGWWLASSCLSAVSSRRFRIQSQPFKHEQAKPHFSLPVRYGDTKDCYIMIRSLIELL